MTKRPGHRRTHGMNGTPIYGAWCRMIARVRPDHPQRAEYFDRGISVCERWRRFEAFYEDMAPMPDGMSLDRIDNNVGYQPGNCRWANATEQARNRRSNTILEHDGLAATVAEWSERTGLSPGRIIRRIQSGWSVAKALSTPARIGRYTTKKRIVDASQNGEQS